MTNVDKYRTESKKGKYFLIKESTDIVEQIHHKLNIWIYKDYGESAKDFQESDNTKKLLQKLLQECEGMFSCSTFTLDLICCRQMKEISQIDFNECHKSMLISYDTIKEINQSASEAMQPMDDASEKLESSII